MTNPRSTFRPAARVALPLLALALATPPARAGALDPVNGLGIGTFGGQLQLLAMRRQFMEPAPNVDAASGTLALTLDYATPALKGLSLGVEGIGCVQLFEGGSLDHPNGQAWYILNKDFQTLQHAYLQADLGEFGLKGSVLRVGRQPLNLDFFPSYAIRQKAQAIQGATLTLGVLPKVSVTVGHFTHFSTWSPRDKTDALSVQFEKIADAVGAGYDTDGATFVSADLGLVPGTPITVYDLLLHDLTNTMGVKASHAFKLGEKLTLTPKAHLILQGDTGKLSDVATVDATVIDLALQAKLGATTLEPGLLMTGGDKAENSLNVPFRTSLTADPLLLWYARVFLGGAQTTYLKATGAVGKLKLTAMLAQTTHQDWVDGGATDGEANVVLSYPLTKTLTTAIKAGYGDQAKKTSADKSASDLRLFVTWKL
jgi:hypothetical protein